MKIHQYMQGRAVRYFKPVIFDDDNKVILSGGGLRIFDCQKEKFVQTISRLCNAISGLSYSESKLFVINATSKGSVICIIYERIGETFCEMQRQTIKGVNTDGGGPYFSSDEKYVFFCTESRRVWRYSLEDKTCTCIYEREYSDQSFFLDVYADQLLIILRTSGQDDHCGIDVLDKDGTCLKSLRYHDARVNREILRGGWLNEDEVLMVYPRIYDEPYDDHQIIQWRSAVSLKYAANNWKIERAGNGLSSVCISPMRNYIAYIWINMESVGYKVGIYSFQSLQKIAEFAVEHYPNATFSNDDKYFFLCSDKYLKADLTMIDKE